MPTKTNLNLLLHAFILAQLPRQTSTLQTGFTGKEHAKWKTGGLQTGISCHVWLCNCLPTQDSSEKQVYGQREKEWETDWEEEKREQSEEQKEPALPSSWQTTRSNPYPCVLWVPVRSKKLWNISFHSRRSPDGLKDLVFTHHTWKIQRHYSAVS